MVILGNKSFLFLGVVIIVAGFCFKNSNPLKDASIMCIVISILIIVSSGFFIQINETPIIFQTISYVNFFKVQFESVILILFKDRCESTPILYNSYDINESQLSYNLYHLIIEAIILRMIGFIVMLFQTNTNLSRFFIRFIKFN